MKFLFSPGNAVYLIALGVMVILGIAAFALGAFEGDAEVDVDADADLGVAGSALAWLGFGLVPTSLLGLAGLTAFGAFGLIVSLATRPAAGVAGPLLYSLPAAILGALASSRLLTVIFRRLSLEGESSAINPDSLVGHVATITLGKTVSGKPTQAKVQDRHGQVHYFLVEPALPEDSFGPGENVVLVQRDGARFLVIGEGAENLDRLSTLSIKPKDR